MEPITNVTATRNKKNPPTIIVGCEVLVYSSNDKIVMKKAESQGINKYILLINVTVEKHEGPMKGTYEKAEKEFEGADIPTYKQVQVQYDGGSLPAIDIIG